MGHARCELAEGAQLVGPGGAIALLLLLGDVMSNTQHAGSLAVHNDGRAVYRCVADGTVTGHIACFETLRLARQGESESVAAHFAIIFVRALEEAVADDL